MKNTNAANVPAPNMMRRYFLIGKSASVTFSRAASAPVMTAKEIRAICFMPSKVVFSTSKKSFSWESLIVACGLVLGRALRPAFPPPLTPRINLMKKALVSGLLFCCCAAPVPVHADTVYCVNCSDKLTQMLDRVTNVQQLQTLMKAYSEAVQQTAAQLELVAQHVKEYENMIQHTIQLPREMIRKISSKLSEAGRITAALNSIRADVEGLARIYDELYGTRDELKNLANLPRNMLTQGVATYHTSWDRWSERVDKATQATFQLSGHQLKQLADSGELEGYINGLLSTPEGQQQALMAANQLAALQIQEARQLRELIATKVQSDLASQTKGEKERQMGEEVQRQMLNGSGVSTTPHPDPF